jgi:hypothetical protein
MQRYQMPQEARSQHIKYRGKVLMQHLCNRDLIMLMRLPKPLQVPLKASLSLPTFNLPLHDRHICAQLERLAVSEPEIVVGRTFEELNAFSGERGIEVREGLGEELGEEEKRRSLVESIAFVVDERTASASEGVLLYNCDFEASFCETCSRGDAANACAWRLSATLGLGVLSEFTNNDCGLLLRF